MVTSPAPARIRPISSGLVVRLAAGASAIAHSHHAAGGSGWGHGGGGPRRAGAVPTAPAPIAAIGARPMARPSQPPAELVGLLSAAPATATWFVVVELVGWVDSLVGSALDGMVSEVDGSPVELVGSCCGWVPGGCAVGG